MNPTYAQALFIAGVGTLAASAFITYHTYRVVRRHGWRVAPLAVGLLPLVALFAWVGVSAVQAALGI